MDGTSRIILIEPDLLLISKCKGCKTRTMRRQGKPMGVSLPSFTRAKWRTPSVLLFVLTEKIEIELKKGLPSDLRDTNRAWREIGSDGW